MTVLQEDRYPQPPPGYQPAILFQYPKVRLQVAAIILLAAITPLLFILAWVLQRQLAWGSLAIVGRGTDLLLVIGVVLVTTTLHELVHGMAYRLLGYRVTYGVSGHLLAAYAAAFKQWQTRVHNIMVALAPLVVLTGVFLPMIAIQNRTVVLIAVTALMMNSAGAVGDIYLIWRLMRMPRATLLYDVDVKTMLVYKPECGSERRPA